MDVKDSKQHENTNCHASVQNATFTFQTSDDYVENFLVWISVIYFTVNV